MNEMKWIQLFYWDNDTLWLFCANIFQSKICLITTYIRVRYSFQVTILYIILSVVTKFAEFDILFDVSLKFANFVANHSKR